MLMFIEQDSGSHSGTCLPSGANFDNFSL